MNGAIEGWHASRSWVGTAIEDACPCPKEPCGMVNSGNTSPDCAQHQPNKTVRRAHSSDQCPGMGA